MHPMADVAESVRGPRPLTSSPLTSPLLVEMYALLDAASPTEAPLKLPELISWCGAEKKEFQAVYGPDTAVRELEVSPGKNVRGVWRGRMNRSVAAYLRETQYGWSALRHVRFIGAILDCMLNANVFVELSPGFVQELIRRPNAWSTAFACNYDSYVEIDRVMALFLTSPIHLDVKSSVATFQRMMQVVLADMHGLFFQPRSFGFQCIEACTASNLADVEAQPREARIDGDQCNFDQFVPKWAWLWSTHAHHMLSKTKGEKNSYDRGERTLRLPVEAMRCVVDAFMCHPSDNFVREKAWLPCMSASDPNARRLQNYLDIHVPETTHCLAARTIPFVYVDLLTAWIRPRLDHPLFTTSVLVIIVRFLAHEEEGGAAAAPPTFSAFQKLILWNAGRIVKRLSEQKALAVWRKPNHQALTKASTELALRPLPMTHRGYPLAVPTSFRRETTEGMLETDINDPIVYARTFDTYGTCTVLEDILECPIETLMGISKVWAHYHPGAPRRVIMVTFASFDDLSSKKPCRNKHGGTFVWMPEGKLFSPYAASFGWTLPYFVPGESLLVYLNVHTTGRTRNEFEGRVLVANAVSCAPLLAGCPVCTHVGCNGERKFCTKCRWVSYCCKDDQVAHFGAQHKAVCGQYAFLTGAEQSPLFARGIVGDLPLLGVPAADRAELFLPSPISYATFQGNVAPHLRIRPRGDAASTSSASSSSSSSSVAASSSPAMQQ